MPSVIVTVRGDTEAMLKFEALKLGLVDMKVPLTAIGKSLVDYYSGPVFASQGGAIGVAWPTLAAKTIAYKLKHYTNLGGSNPLIRTGAMQKAFKFEATPTVVTISNDAPYFKYHQSSAARTKIPYRPMMAINEPVKMIINDIITADIDLKMKA